MNYPVDHARTTRQHAGETLKNTANIPGLIAVVVGVVALGVGVYELAAGDVRIGLVAAILAAGSGVAGLGWLNFAHRRVRQAELQLVAMGSKAPAPPPSS
ncbi:hypothetical protein AWC29_11115 [Mycobacterium triplex]|uniref:UsfY protein n=1 Tax=Mycobacterium triplex TaxID=47839 RepID=A0A024JQV8_9MYCO|nr:hypothetical protein [Mycobacterium triplex]ORX05393.1 hypothetical protein AWC29_11115 [Mycobacterium triplex]CDO85712.1 UsfY protein [Mycobacterium triplex]